MPYKVREISKRIVNFEKAYLATLREQMRLYASLADTFPNYLKGRKRYEIYFGDDGILIIQWPNNDTDNDVFVIHDSNLSVCGVMESIPELRFSITSQIPRGFDITVLAIEMFGKDESVIWKSGWEKVRITTCAGKDFWSIGSAVNDALLEVQSYATPHLMKLEDQSPNTLLIELEKVIGGFKDLLDTATREEDLQQYLNNNPVLLSPSALRITPQVRLGSEYRTDFVIEVLAENYILVEIERCEHKLFTQGGNPTHELTHAIQQVRDWRQWVHDNVSYARNSLPGINDPDGLVIIGRQKDLSVIDKRRLDRLNREQPHITVLTFDDLFNCAKQYLSNLQVFWSKVKGNN
jgi:hypothetical protein